MKEIDLHGLKMTDALQRFVEMHNSLVGGGRGAALKVIHGYGSSGPGGEIKNAIRKMLSQNPVCAHFVRGEEMDGNPGYTVVYPKRRLPTGIERLWDMILEFCSTPRTQEQILSKFVRRSSEPDINEAVRGLLGRGRLTVVTKNGRRHYVAPRNDYL